MGETSGLCLYIIATVCLFTTRIMIKVHQTSVKAIQEVWSGFKFIREMKGIKSLWKRDYLQNHRFIMNEELSSIFYLDLQLDLVTCNPLTFIEY